MQNNECIKAFISFSRQNYYENAKQFEPELIDRISLGNFDADGNGCEYEFQVEWTCLGGEATPQLKIFSDALKCLADHRELLDELAQLHDKHFTPDELSRLLVKLGYKDMSDNPLEEVKTDFQRFQREIEAAINQYGVDHIDVVYSEDKIWGMYHSSKNSFSVTEDYSSAMASKKEIEGFCNTYDIGCCEE